MHESKQRATRYQIIKKLVHEAAPQSLADTCIKHNNLRSDEKLSETTTIQQRCWPPYHERDAEMRRNSAIYKDKDKEITYREYYYTRPLGIGWALAGTSPHCKHVMACTYLQPVPSLAAASVEQRLY